MWDMSFSYPTAYDSPLASRHSKYGAKGDTKRDIKRDNVLSKVERKQGSI